MPGLARLHRPVTEGSAASIADPHESLPTDVQRTGAPVCRRATSIGDALKLSTALRRAALVTVALATLGLGLTQGAAIAAPANRSAAVTTIAAYQTPRLTKMVTEAIHQTTLGVMYAAGGGHGSSPAPLGSNVDCSGFVREMYGYAFNTDIGNGSGDSMIRLSGEFTRTSYPVPGDVALFGNSGNAPAYHAGIYIGMINGHPAAAAASQTGTPIKIQQWYDRYWPSDLMGYWHYNGATAADSGPAVQAKMSGSFDSASGTPGGFRVSGWAVDPQLKASTTTVAVTVDNKLVANVTTNTARADVNRVTGATGNHGFTAGIATPVGWHTVCVTAQPAGTSSAEVNLGCKIVSVPRPTTGSFDSATGGKLALRATGWAMDPSASSVSNTVRITVDGRPDTARAGISRPDVNRVLSITGNHGFAVPIAATAGRHFVCVISTPTSAASYQRSLGCKTVTVTA